MNGVTFAPATHPDIPTDRPRVFVYGTLQPGQGNFRILDRHVIALYRSTISGQLYDTRYGFPAVRLDESNTVHGWVAILDGPDGLCDLDELEGEGFMYRRRAVVEEAVGATTWIYEWIRGGSDELSVHPTGLWDGPPVELGQVTS